MSRPVDIRNNNKTINNKTISNKTISNKTINNTNTSHNLDNAHYRTHPHNEDKD